MRVPRFEYCCSSRGKQLFADDVFHILTRARRPRPKCYQRSHQNQINERQKSPMGLMNYKQMPINNGHPFGVPQTRRGLIIIIVGDATINKQKKMPLGVVATTATPARSSERRGCFDTNLGLGPCRHLHRRLVPVASPGSS